MQTIRDNIKTRQADRGWTVYRLAKVSGVSEATVRKFLSGQIDTTTERADAMLAALAQKRSKKRSNTGS